MKDFEDLFATFIDNNDNKSLLDGSFPEDLETTEVVSVYRRKTALTKVITDRKYFLKYSQTCLQRTPAVPKNVSAI